MCYVCLLFQFRFFHVHLYTDYYYAVQLLIYALAMLSVSRVLQLVFKSVSLEISCHLIV